MIIHLFKIFTNMILHVFKLFKVFVLLFRPFNYIQKHKQFLSIIGK